MSSAWVLFLCALLAQVRGLHLDGLATWAEPTKVKASVSDCSLNTVTLCSNLGTFDYANDLRVRMCLASHAESLDNGCVKFLNDEHPSIVEPCFPEIKAHCDHVTKDANTIAECLLDHGADVLSLMCFAALGEAQGKRNHPPLPTEGALGSDDQALVPKEESTHMSTSFDAWRGAIRSTMGAVALRVVRLVTDESPTTRRLRRRP